MWISGLQELEKLNIQMNMTSKQMQEKLLASLDEREEMEIRIEDLGQSIVQESCSDPSNQDPLNLGHLNKLDPPLIRTP